MRAAPAIQVTISGHGASRWLMVALASASAAAGAWWLGSRLAGPTASMIVAVGMAGMLAALLAWRASSRPPLELRFDGQGWRLSGCTHGGVAQTLSGEIAVVIDLGAWMLLRFDAPADDVRKRCRRWLPVSRRELQAPWHALRCAVYSPRPGAPSGSRDAQVDPFSRE